MNYLKWHWFPLFIRHIRWARIIVLQKILKDHLKRRNHPGLGTTRVTWKAYFALRVSEFNPWPRKRLGSCSLDSSYAWRHGTTQIHTPTRLQIHTPTHLHTLIRFYIFSTCWGVGNVSVSIYTKPQKRRDDRPLPWTILTFARLANVRKGSWGCVVF